MSDYTADDALGEHLLAMAAHVQDDDFSLSPRAGQASQQADQRAKAQADRPAASGVRHTPVESATTGDSENTDHKLDIEWGVRRALGRIIVCEDEDEARRILEKDDTLVVRTLGAWVDA